MVTSSTTGNSVRVAAKRTIADGICELTLTDPCGRHLPDWTPGAHLDLMLPGDRVRQYSLCGDRGDAHNYRVAVLRERDGRGGSAYIHDVLGEGDLLGIGGPRNNFRLRPASHILFIAGGIGITPILTMVRAAEAMGTSWALLYGGRSRDTMAFVGELEQFGDRVQIVPQDAAGLPDLEAAIGDLPAGASVYCCGPTGLLEAVGHACEVLPAGSLRLERFVAQPPVAPVRRTGFTVEIASSGTVVEVDPTQSIADALAATGAPVLTSCKQGICGTCETGVLAGDIDHRDSLLSDEERRRGDVMFVCVSRSCSDRLVLDL
ncbi:PDR/VanB family oxidoreductase [Nocardioides sp. NPDC006303]|uniref:PDR/VanB family oxidoreductase n=1 Tax=Nocardioides sp. NPDC006303 TaxID=3156747 RepID=UPI0033BA5884